MSNKRPLGQAYTKSQKYIYTWWSDGSVTYHEVIRHDSGDGSGNEIVDINRPPHDSRYFYAFVPVQPPAELSDADRGE